MKNIKHKLLLTFTLVFTINFAFSQEKKSDYNTIVYKISGDLNKDNIPDLVVVKEDNTSKHNPYLLEIFFQNKNGKYETVLTSRKAVMEKYPYGDQRTELILENLQIKNGILIFRNDMIRGSMIHKFRFQNGEFELIGYTYTNASAGYIEHTDYNLSTGEKVDKHTDYQTDKILKFTKTKQKMQKLPKLKDFTPFDFTY